MDRNQSGMSYEELRKMRLSFTEDYIPEIKEELDKLSKAYDSMNQDDMKLIVDEITRKSMVFRAVIDGPSDSDGVYKITTEE